MFKRFVCIILSTAMLLLISSPVFAVPVETTALPASAEPVTMESILNDFYAQTFSAEGQDSDTIKQNTINQLTEAGYSAYDLNPATLSSLENSLNTDFSAMGLDPEGSYLIIVSGEDQPSAEISPITPPSGDASVCGFGDGDILPPIHTYDPDQPPGGDDTFTYTYSGQTYLMRYVTVSGADSQSHYVVNSETDLYDTFDMDTIANLFNWGITALPLFVNVPFWLGTVLSITGNLLPYCDPAQTTSLDFDATTSWTRTFTQVYDYDTSSWLSCSYVEYATLTAYLNHYYYDPDQKKGVQKSGQIVDERMYSTHYSNTSWQKEKAAIGYLLSQCQADSTGDIFYYYNEELVLWHSIPALPLFDGQ